MEVWLTQISPLTAHGPILDWQHLLHIITTVNLPPAPQHMPARGRDRSVSPRRRPGGGPRESRGQPRWATAAC